MMAGRKILILGLLALGGLCAGAGTLGCAGNGGENGAPLMLRPCRLDGIEEEILCGFHEVYEDRAARSGRTISLSVAVIPAIAAAPERDPLFVLAGGPGQAATEIGPTILPALRKIRAKRDIVLVDQRGTGGSNALQCRSEEEDLERLFSSQFQLELLRECREDLDADPRMYTTPIAMDDLDEVRRALGYAQINLYGGSYGTRAALVYMRRHPEAVRAAILDGAAPPSIKLPLHMARDAQEALRRAFEDCDDDAECHAAFPGLGECFATLLDALERASARVEARHPRTGERVEVEITRDMFVSSLRGALYDPNLASLIPLILRRATEGDFDPVVALGLTLNEGIGETISIGMFLSVVCSEDIPQITAADREAALPGTFLGGVMLDAVEEACEVWPRGVLPAGYHDPVSSDLPVLILSGSLDPATPPRWGEAIARHLPRALHVLAPGVGHNVLPHGCVPDIAARFIETGTAEDLDVSCVDRLCRPPFFLAPSGPAP